MFLDCQMFSPLNCRHAKSGAGSLPADLSTTILSLRGRVKYVTQVISMRSHLRLGHQIPMKLTGILQIRCLRAGPN